MKESTRRIIIFVVIVATGTILIVADIPLIYLILLVLAVGFVLLLLLGALTITDIQAAFSRIRKKNLKPRRSPVQLGAVNLPEQKTAPLQIPLPVTKKPEKTAGKVPEKMPERPAGIRRHIGSFITSILSIGRIMGDRGKHTKKIEDINRMLDHTVAEKVKGSALASAGEMTGTSANMAGGARRADQQEEQDPFLSLSGDELDTGLLDAIDENEPAASSATAPESSSPGTPEDAASDLDIPDLDMPHLPDDVESDAEPAKDDGSDEFAALDGAEAIDDAFGDLDGISMEDVDLDENSDTAKPMPMQTDANGPAQSAEVPPDEIPSPLTEPPSPADLIPKEDDTSGEQAEMAMFDVGSGADSDLLSSLASEIKHVKKELDLSLLRDLKDFKAPASEIESELEELHDQICAGTTEAKKEQPLPEEGK
jgi:hypothetical protein